MLVGAGIAFLLISLFLIGVRNPKPEWGTLWMIRPLIVVAFAGAMGGLCNYFILNYSDRIGVNRLLATIVSALVFIVGLWLGFVLGLNGTLWN
ncbi:hypothetical protein GCM10028805_60490 [Spirosoma harenae]